MTKPKQMGNDNIIMDRDNKFIVTNITIDDNNQVEEFMKSNSANNDEIKTLTNKLMENSDAINENNDAAFKIKNVTNYDLSNYDTKIIENTYIKNSNSPNTNNDITNGTVNEEEIQFPNEKMEIASDDLDMGQTQYPQEKIGQEEATEVFSNADNNYYKNTEDKEFTTIERKRRRSSNTMETDKRKKNELAQQQHTGIGHIER